jgi:serine/threonine protein kinase
MAQLDSTNNSSYPSPSERLDKFFLRYESSNMAIPRYSDSDIQQISKLLEEIHSDWSQVPRTYIVLRIIGELDLLSDLISLGFNDLWFPVSMNLLPESLSDSVRARFVDVQKVVLTKTIDLEKGENGKHRSFAEDEDLPFQTKAQLGRGGFSKVDKVLSRLSYREYARKLIHRKMFFGQAKDAMKTFLTELEILKRLKHHHIVELVGSYTVPRYLGLIMSPVADANLSEFLETVPANPDRKLLIRGFFGCLIAALVYLHGNRIRHKDIKPQNILVKDDTVLFTDFGISLDWSNMSRSTTEGFPSAFTRKYCAPEVANEGPRNSSSDVWSLGCVFLEMVTVLKGETITAMGSFFENHGSQARQYCDNLVAIGQWIEAIRIAEGIELDNVSFDWIQKMLQLDSSSRPTSRQLMESINHNPNLELRTKFCGICCMYDDESYTSRSSVDDGITDPAVSTIESMVEVRAQTGEVLVQDTNPKAMNTSSYY